MSLCARLFKLCIQVEKKIIYANQKICTMIIIKLKISYVNSYYNLINVYKYIIIWNRKKNCLKKKMNLNLITLFVLFFFQTKIYFCSSNDQYNEEKETKTSLELVQIVNYILLYII